MPDKSFLFSRPPLWKSHEQSSQRQLPADLQSWLNETGSLTKRLRGIHGNRFGVKLLFHRWKPALIDECRLLGLQPCRYQLIREVLLHADGVPLVLARTILPEPTIEIAHRNLSHLGTRPLGEVIFAYPDLERRQRQFSRADSHIWSPGLQTEVGVDDAIWGRRTVYAIHGQPLLVAEFFLPAVLAPAVEHPPKIDKPFIQKS
ncbi:chorismate--pyruvate lyase family protein [Methylomonas rosea]|uniref:Probable chorismate pyruvate-lyase n=1 Tax=Methylomonas rosea TaxID=2952227 RepID=A0ABT1TR44_9GAMM|nr:chorismate lyase [Methylomonas sp. WSC-7]MCQ8117245.1 chorismate lyase [Methylomonas sp. WSC-7]